MIKMIVTDVDDTVVPEAGNVISQEYYDVIRRFRKKGILVGVASGRQKPCVKNLFEPVLDEIFILADNGTDIWAKDYKTSTKIADEDYKELADEIDKLSPEYSSMACKPDIAYVKNGQTEFYNHMIGYPYEMEYVEDPVALKDICKISVWKKEGIDPKLEEVMQKRWSDRLDVCLAGECFLDFMHKGCNKGNALSIIQEHYGIKSEETVAFGNADNDIPMLKRAKYSYAVAGATENLKSVAYEVIGEMKDDAVLQKLKEILESVE